MSPEEIREIVKEELDKLVSQGSLKAIHSSQLIPKMIKQRHIEDVVIKFGLLADRPTDGGAVNTRGYFSTDNDTLALWNGSAWVEEILT